MRFPRGLAASAPEDLLGELATRLEARVSRRGLPPAAPAERATILFEARACEPALLCDLRQVEGAELRIVEAGLARLTLLPERLRALGERHAAARCLAAAQAAATAPRARPLVLGILNVTPDSFSDGGAFLDAGRALEHGLALVEEGADWIDVGGESTRPGSESVPVEVELERVLPVVSALVRDGRAAVSIDTTKSAVARAALDAGATVVNDVSAGRNDPALLALVAERGAGLVLMHAQGAPRDMQRAPSYTDATREVTAHLRARACAAWKAGVDPARIALDPGFGFGKHLEHNLELVRALAELRSLGFPLCVGLSRKSFLGRLTGQEEPAQRTSETLAATTLAAYLGAELHRVHAVGPARAALAIAEALAADKEGRG